MSEIVSNNIINRNKSMFWSRILMIGMLKKSIDIKKPAVWHNRFKLNGQSGPFLVSYFSKAKGGKESPAHAFSYSDTV